MEPNSDNSHEKSFCVALPLSVEFWSLWCTFNVAKEIEPIHESLLSCFAHDSFNTLLLRKMNHKWLEE